MLGYIPTLLKHLPSFSHIILQPLYLIISKSTMVLSAHLSSGQKRPFSIVCSSHLHPIITFFMPPNLLLSLGQCRAVTFSSLLLISWPFGSTVIASLICYCSSETLLCTLCYPLSPLRLLNLLSDHLVLFSYMSVFNNIDLFFCTSIALV